MIIQSLGIERVPFNSDLNFPKDSVYYAGIGSRFNIPDNIRETMIKIAYYFGLEGLVLRSGGALGSDTYFEIGADLARTVKNNCGLKQIFLSKEGASDNPSCWHIDNPELFPDRNVIYKELSLLGSQFHLGLATMNEESKLLIIRNGQQVMGPYLNSLSMCVICWTPDGALEHKDRNKLTGGTGQAISIASTEYISTNYDGKTFIKDGKQQIINLRISEHLNIVLEKIKKLEDKHGLMPDWKTTLSWQEIGRNKKFKP